MSKIVFIVFGGIALALIGLALWVQFAWDRHFEAPYPEIRASLDPQVIARGRYLAYGPSHCAGCHVPPGKKTALKAGEEPPLAGGMRFPLGALGTIWAPNITPHGETGIGRRTDAELARVIRYGVHADGRALLPFMEFQTLSDADLTAVISFLRSQPPVHNPVRPMDVQFKGKLALAFFVKPQGPKIAPRPVPPPVSDSIAYGGYLVESVAQCAGCHTDRSKTNGSEIGPRLAGGWLRKSDEYPGVTLVTPNLTPDPQTGRMAKWSEEAFVARFRAGNIYPESDMPWSFYAKMTDDDLRAIYRYLHSLAPVRKDTGQSVRRTG